MRSEPKDVLNDPEEAEEGLRGQEELGDLEGSIAPGTPQKSEAKESLIAPEEELKQQDEA